MSDLNSTAQHKRRIRDLKIGDEIGRWTIREGPTPRQAKSGRKELACLCECSCGTMRNVSANALARGGTYSCGCRQREQLHEFGRTHNQSGTRLYEIWCGIKKRCTNPASSHFARYGGRGIRICEEWQAFEPFRDWALANGYRDDLTIERKENSGHYEPSNCCWATRKDQAQNTRNTLHLTALGETKSMSEWLRDPRCHISMNTLRYRLSKGWSHEQAITQPPDLSRISNRNRQTSTG